MNLIINSQAELDATDAALYYDEHRQGLGSDVLQAIGDAINRVVANPHRWGA